MNTYRGLKLQDLNPTFGTFEDEHVGIDATTARWYKGANDATVSWGKASGSFIDSTVSAILRETAQLRYAGKLEPFRPGPIGAYKRQPPRVVSEREVADYHRKEREGNRKEMLRLREQNNVALSMLGGQ